MTYQYINIKRAILMTCFFCLAQEGIGQDSFYVSPNCFKELLVRCANKEQDIRRVKIKRKLIKDDLHILDQVQSFLLNKDTTIETLIRKPDYIEFDYRKSKNRDSIIRSEKIYLNYFTVYVYTFIIDKKASQKLAIIRDALTFYCESEMNKEAHNYILIDPVFFRKYLQKELRVNYFYECAEIYLNSPYFFW